MGTLHQSVQNSSIMFNNIPYIAYQNNANHLFNHNQQSSSQSQWNNSNNFSNHNSNFQPQQRGFIESQSHKFERSLLPTTIKQILSSPSPQNDESFKIDGIEIHQIEIVASIKSIQPQSTHTLFIIDDQNASIECKLWSSTSADIKELEAKQLKKGDKVRIIGRVDTFKNVKAINVHSIVKVTDPNEIALHGLEVIFAHELNELIVNQHDASHKQMFDKWIKIASNYRKTQHTVDDSKFKLSYLGKSLLKWFRMNHVDGDLRGHFVENIRKHFAIECSDKEFDDAICELHKHGLIYDGIENHWLLTTED